MGAFDERPVRALAVDLANLSIKTDTPVMMGSNSRQPLLFRDVIDIMNDLYGFEFSIPIFFVIDARVVPYNMTRPETEDLWRMESAAPDESDRVWRIRKQRFGISRREDDKSKFKERADAALCELANKRNVAIISGDRFYTESQSGKLQRPLDLIRFRPYRETREESFTFYNESLEHGDRPLPQLVADLTDDEYWDEWYECAQILSGHMEKEQKRSDRYVISEWLKGRVRSAAISASTTTTKPPEILPVQETNQSTSTPAGGSLPAARIDHAPPEKSVPMVAVPASQPTADRLVPDAVFVFRDLRDLRAHQGMTVEMVSRPFWVDEQLFFRLYAAGSGVLIEVAEIQNVKTEHEFMSATGQLELADHGWVLRDASINGVVSAAEVEELKSLGRRLDPPTFTPWGRLPRWRWRRQQHDQSVEEHLSGPDTETEVDQPRPNPEPKPPETVNPVGESSTDSGTPPGPTSTPPTPPKVPAETTPENAGTSAPASTTPSRIDSNGQAEPTAEETDLPAPDVDDETESPESVRGPDGDNEPEGETEPRDHRRLVMAGVAVGVAIALVVPFRILTNDGAGKSAATPAGAPFGAGGSRAMHTH